MRKSDCRGPSVPRLSIHRRRSPVRCVYGLFRLEARGKRERLPGRRLRAGRESRVELRPVAARDAALAASAGSASWPSRSCTGGRSRSCSTSAARSRCAAAAATPRRSRPRSSSSRDGEIVVMFPEGTRQQERDAEEDAGAPAHRRRAHRAARRRAARPGGDQGNGSAVARSEVRRKGRRSTASAFDPRRGRAGGDGPADERHREAVRDAVTAAARQSTATRSRTARTTRCRSRSTATRSSASRT